jgi:hypothetical protein
MTGDRITTSLHDIMSITAGVISAVASGAHNFVYVVRERAKKLFL